MMNISTARFSFLTGKSRTGGGSTLRDSIWFKTYSFPEVIEEVSFFRFAFPTEAGIRPSTPLRYMPVCGRTRAGGAFPSLPEKNW
jgi:hypothetical protein